MLELRQGNKYKLAYTIVNADDSPKDLTGSLEIKYELARAKHRQALIQKSLDNDVVIVSPTEGKIAIFITAEDLANLREGKYYHEVHQVNALGDPTTLLAENVQIYSSLIKE